MKRLIMLLFVTSCATPYQPAGFRGGYTDSEISPGMHQVVFSGNSRTSTATTERFALQRGRELCASKGYSDIEIVSLNSTNTSQQVNNNGQPLILNKPSSTLLMKCTNEP